ncbi:MAG TPA: FxsA family protein [Aliidongia sp.]|uniref:FxsA family protein n=1 Tax=Aliidongia sp. TaxID=1914230 RepID=UPI002DDD3B0A|nr:FxsA family protein [Aliidongia sp.]HEV2676857.1 FxsA family protein [Aliidongia sp.]
MGFLPFLLALPLIEIAGFVLLGPYLGVGGTLAEIILTGMIGMAVVRRQGFETLVRLRAAAQAGETPLPVAVDGGAQVLAGVLLTVPGFFTDAIGLLLLVPPLRQIAVTGALRWLARSARVPATQPGAGRTVIETDYEIVEREVPPDRRIDRE